MIRIFFLTRLKRNGFSLFKINDESSDEPEDDDMDLLVKEDDSAQDNVDEISEEGLLRALMEAEETKK